MSKTLAEQTVAEYLKALYGFSLHKTANLQDAEDLTQDIALKLYNALLANGFKIALKCFCYKSAILKYVVSFDFIIIKHIPWKMNIK